MLSISRKSFVFAGTLLAGALLLVGRAAMAAPPEFPKLGTAASVRGELLSVDFIHRMGKFRAADGKLTNFTMPPYGIMTYRATEADLRDVPLGTEMEFLLLPDGDGKPTQLVGTKHGDRPDGEPREKFVEFTKARGVAGWIDITSGKRVTITFFSGTPELFRSTWDASFTVGTEVRVCVANDELRTWQPTSCGEKGTVVEVEDVPIEGYGSSGRRVVVQVNNMLEGFRQGRVVRVFGGGWPVRNQLFQECLINYGYNSRPVVDFRECYAKHYPEQFPYRTDYGNRELPWFQARAGEPLPLHSEHVMYGDLTYTNESGNGGEFKLEPTGETVSFTLLDGDPRSRAIQYRSENFEGRGAKLTDLALDRRYRFHMYQDSKGRFTLCSAIFDEYTRASLNNLEYKIRAIDRERNRIEVDWQGGTVFNYQKDPETPPPYGRSLLQLGRDTRVWNGDVETSLQTLKIGDPIKFAEVSELPGRPAYCTEFWIIENTKPKAKKKR